MKKIVYYIIGIISILLIYDGNVTINHTETKNYLIYNGIKIRNDFKKYTYEKSDDMYVLYDKNDDLVNAFSIYETNTFIDVFKTYNNDILSEQRINMFLKENNISNDIELITYISKYSKFINVLSSNYDIKLDYYIRNYINDIFPLVYEYKIIDGDYTGIMTYNLNYEEEKNIEVMLINDDVRYVITFIGSGIEEKNIINLIGTVVFDEEEK